MSIEVTSADSELFQKIGLFPSTELYTYLLVDNGIAYVALRTLDQAVSVVGYGKNKGGSVDGNFIEPGQVTSKAGLVFTSK